MFRYRTIELLVCSSLVSIIFFPKEIQSNAIMEYHYTDTIEIPIPSETSELIQIPEGVESIPEHHYEDCDRLELIRIPNTVQKIGDYAFRCCSSLQIVYIPEGVQTIGVGCFCNCYNMKIVHIPHSVCEIKREAFEQCKSLYSVTLPQQLKCISDFCFYECKMLGNIVIPPSVTSIGTYAFGGCTSLIEIIFPSNIKIRTNSFRECIHLKKMTFLDQLTNTDSIVPNLGKNAFMACKSLVEVNLSCYPVYTIKQSCFEQCESLERIILSKKTRKLMDCSFGFCSTLKYIGYESLLEPTKNTEIKFGLDLEHIDVVSWKAFADCTSLESVRLHNHSCIQGTSFDGCKSLKKISLPSGFRIQTDILGNKLYDLFPSNNVDDLILPSETKNFSYSVIFYVMYKLIQRNPCLLSKQFTMEKLYPFEVAVTWLNEKGNTWWQEADTWWEGPDELWIHNVLYHYIRNAPWLLLPKESIHQINNCCE